MKKVLLFVHLLLIVVATTYAQSLNEDFEGDQFPPKGWETRCIEYSLLSYPKWEQVNNKDINTFVTGYKGGKLLSLQVQVQVSLHYGQAIG